MRSIYRKLLLSAAFGIPAISTLSACGDFPRARTESEIRDMAEDEADAIASRKADSSRVDELEERVEKLEERLRLTSASLDEARSNHESLRNTFNGNVDIENRSRAREMTRRGACGQEVEQVSGGGVIVRNKECTVNDLR